MGKCRRDLNRFVRACFSTAAVGMLAVAASGQSNIAEVPQRADAAGADAYKIDSFRAEQPARMRGTGGTRIVDRGSPPFPGGGCQTQDTNAALNYGANFITADNFNPSSSGTVTGVSWSAVYVNATTGAGVTPPAAESFRIRFRNDNAGVPGTVIGSAITVNNPTRVNSGSAFFTGAPVWDYTATVAGPAVTAGTCYWLEITNNSAPGTGNATFWLQANPIPGDTIAYQTFGIPCVDYDALNQVGGDMTFCVNVALNNLNGANCIAAVIPPAPCANSAANGNGIDNNLGTGYSSVSPGTTYTGTARFQRADLFRVGTSGSITSVCFWGFFAQQVAGGRTDHCAKDFDITFWNVNPATLEPTTALATRKVGTAGVTLARGLDADGNESYSASFPTGVAVTAGTCYALSISAPLATADATRQAAFIWGGVEVPTSPNPVHDNRFWSRTVSLAGVAGAWASTNPPNTQSQNLSFLFNVGPMQLPNCVPPPANDLCSGAVTLTIGGAVVTGTNVEATADALGGCGFNLVDNEAVWYTFVGNGNDVTVSTCNASTPTTDTVIHVFCADTCAGPFNCVGGNDDADAACGTNAFASTITVPTTLNQRYYVLVHHPIQNFDGVQFVARNPGPFGITVANGPASVNPPACSTLARCVIDNEPFDISEVDNCAANVGDTNNVCTGASVYTAVGQVARGNLSTNGAFRDFDMWVLPASLNGAQIEVNYRGENPVILQVQNFNPDCTATPTVVTGVGLASCIPLDAGLVEVQLPTTGVNVVLLLPPSFDGQPCTGDNAFNDYRLQVNQAVIGACCIEATACFTTTFSDCADQSVGDNDFFAANLTCAPQPCDSQPGKCCLPDGSCQLTPNATIGNAVACAGAGGTYTLDGVCTPNTCPSGANIACCRGTTCSLLAPAACTGPNTQNTGGGACNAPGNNTTPCCKADFNHGGGVTVQDIFDFLAAYFTGNPFADINGGGTTVQDIFDYLAAYFSGCP